MSSATILLLPILLNFIPLCVTALAASDSAPCNSSCGNITNISFPFILNNSLSGVDPSFCPSSSYMDNPNFQLFCDHAEDKLYALYQSNDSTTLEVISIHNDSLIVGFANSTANMLAVSGESYCNESETSGLSLPAEYTISDENMFGSFGCTIGVLSTSNLDYDHVENGGCSVLLPENRNNTKCGNRTCCVASLPSASDGGLQYAYYFTTYTPYPYDGLSVNITSLPECLMCSDNYATLFHPDFTDFDTPDFRIKVMWALPVVMNYNASDLLFEKELNQTIVNSPEYACTWDGSSDFIAVPEMQGYRCKCKDGFVGDGYANGTGCTSKKHTFTLSLPLSIALQNHTFHCLLVRLFFSQFIVSFNSLVHLIRRFALIVYFVSCKKTLMSVPLVHPACPMQNVRIPLGATYVIVTLDSNCVLGMAVKMDRVASSHLGYIFFCQVNDNNQIH